MRKPFITLTRHSQIEKAASVGGLFHCNVPLTDLHPVSVATLQQGFCSCIGTALLDLRLAIVALALRSRVGLRGGNDHTQTVTKQSVRA
jgi:hypothetical protein